MSNFENISFTDDTAQSPSQITPSISAGESPARFTPSESAVESPAQFTPSESAGESPANFTPSESAGESPANFTPSESAVESPANFTPSESAGDSPANFTPSESAGDSPSREYTPSDSGVSRSDTPSEPSTPGEYTPTSSEPSTPSSGHCSSTDYIGVAEDFLFAPSLAETVFEGENDDKYMVAKERDVVSCMSNPSKGMYYCNGKVFRHAVGALRESVMAWPTPEIFRCHFTIWDVRRNFSRYSMVSRDFSVFFDNATSLDILASSRKHMKVQPTRNPFIYNDTDKKILKVYWSDMPHFCQNICSHTSGEIPDLIGDNIVCVTEKQDSITLCWAAIMKCGLRTLAQNPRRFWETYEKLLMERHLIWDRGEKKTGDSLSHMCKSMFFTVVQQSSKHIKSRAMRYKRMRVS